MKTLDFPDISGIARFDIVYGGLLTSERGFNRKETRVLTKILDKLEVIATPTGKEGAAAFELKAAGAVELEDAEFTLLFDALSHCRWTAVGARKAAPVFDWLESLRDASND